jgi:hypothetical protein
MCVLSLLSPGSAEGVYLRASASPYNGSMSAEPQHKWTVDEYLAFERKSETRHELVDGEIFEMAGASRAHRITSS